MLTPAEERLQVCFVFVQGAQCFHCSWPAIRLPGLPVVTLGSTIALFAGACREFERAFSIRPLLELGDTRTLMRVCVARVFVSCFAANFGEARCLQNFPNTGVVCSAHASRPSHFFNVNRVFETALCVVAAVSMRVCGQLVGGFQVRYRSRDRAGDGLTRRRPNRLGRPWIRLVACRMASGVIVGGAAVRKGSAPSPVPKGSLSLEYVCVLFWYTAAGSLPSTNMCNSAGSSGRRMVSGPGVCGLASVRT